MFDSQQKTVTKVLELICVFSILLILKEPIIGLDITHGLLSLVLIVFALRYGLKIGMVAFMLSILYSMLLTWQNGEDLFLLFYDFTDSQWFFLYLFLIILTGTFSTSIRERNVDLRYVNHEVETENRRLNSAVTELAHANKLLEEKVMESETSFASVFRFTKKLDRADLESIINEAAQILAHYYKAHAFGIYHLNPSNGTMRIKLRMGDAKKLPQTISLDEAPQFYGRLLLEQQVTVKNAADETEAPLLAALLFSHGNTQLVLVIQQIDFYRLTDHGIQLLQSLTEMFAYYCEKAASSWSVTHKNSLYPDTNIYLPEPFHEWVAIEQEREQKFKQPHVYLEIHVPPCTTDDLKQISQAVIPGLSDVDKLGYDPGRNKLLVLLPGMDEEPSVQHMMEEIVELLFAAEHVTA